MVKTLVLALAALALVAAGCGGGDDEEAEEGAPTATMTAPPGGGGAEAGASVYAEAGCGGCHTLEEAGSTAMIGPPLDEALVGDSADEIRENIVNPDADISEGFSPGVMPQDFGDQLSEQELTDLVAFLEQSAG